MGIEIAGLTVTVLLGLLAWIQAARAQRLSEEIARLQHSLEPPNLKIKILSVELDKQKWVFLAAPLKSKGVVEVPMDVVISNTGGKSARDLECILRLPKALCYGGGEIQVVGSADKASFRRCGESEHLVSFSANCTLLHPEQVLSIRLPLSLLRDSQLDTPVKAKTADGFMVELNFNVLLSSIIDLTIMQTDEPPISKRLDITIVDTSKVTLSQFFMNRNQPSASGASSERKHEGILTTIKSVFRRGRVRRKIKNFKVIEFAPDAFSNGSHPVVHRLKDNALANVCDGLQIDGKFFVPALNAIPDFMKD